MNRLRYYFALGFFLTIGLRATVFGVLPTESEPLYFIYHGQKKALTLDANVIAIHVNPMDGNQGVSRLPNSLFQRGLGPADVIAEPLPGWFILGTAGIRASSKSPMSSQDKGIHALIGPLQTIDPSIDFVSPVFHDQGEGPIIVTPELLVGFQENFRKAQREELRKEMPETATAEVTEFEQPNDERWRIASRDGFAVLAAANALSLANGVAYAEPNMIATGHGSLIPNDPLFPQSWGLRNTGQSGGLTGFDLAATPAWDLTTGSSTLIVVVIDVGVQQNHPDLNLFPGKDFTSDAGLNPDGGPFGVNDNHGTWVAGCVSGRMNNSLGTTGIAPGVKVASARCYNKVQPDGSFTFMFSWVVDGLNWAHTIGARITNNSNFYDTASSAIDAAYNTTSAQGVLHFACAGNDGTPVIAYPAKIPSVNAVGAVDRFGGRTSFSQYGAGLKFMAPGLDIYTTDRTGNNSVPGDYAIVFGTSFSSPYVAGVAALVMSREPALTSAQVESRLITTCTDLGPPGYDTGYGYGLVNAYRAVTGSLPVPPAGTVNISTRLSVQTGENVLIGGFIITGTQTKKVAVRALGPSLGAVGVHGPLADPTLELHNQTGALIASNDNWKIPRQATVQASGLAPSNDLESAIIAALAPNHYTVVVRGNNNTTGVGLVEVYDLDGNVDSQLANISTRGLVQTGDNVMIAGFILGGPDPTNIIVRALGPSVPVSGALANPCLELHDGNGVVIAMNDDWRSTQEAEIIATGVPPTNDLESAIVETLLPGHYTAIERGVDSTTGVGLVEVYQLN